MKAMENSKEIKNVSFWTMSKKGDRPIENQDRVGSWEDEEGVAIALCDGAGSLAHAGEGAACAVEAALRFLKDARNDLASFSNAMISVLLIMCVQWALKKKAEKECIPYSEMGSTLQAAYVDKKRKLAYMIGLGDGRAIFYVNGLDEGAIRPERFPGNQVVLTTSDVAKDHIRVWRSEIANVDTFKCVLKSDGFEEIATWDDMYTITDMLEDRRYGDLSTYLDKKSFKDDATIILMEGVNK